jgi:tRNA modification GTPase
VLNKLDLLPEEPSPEPGAVWISARTGRGVGRLRAEIRHAVGAADQAEGSFSARQRHVDALRRARRHVMAGLDELRASGSGELLAEELRLSQAALGEITGEMLPDDLLGEIFSSFCIGK